MKELPAFLVSAILTFSSILALLLPVLLRFVGLEGQGKPRAYVRLTLLSTVFASECELCFPVSGQ